MIDQSKCFIVYDCCKPVKGYSRSVIYDLQREEYCIIPNIVYDILTKYNRNPLNTVYEFYREQREDLNNCFQFLFNSEFLFFQEMESVSCFPEIDINSDAPGLLENLIIDVDESSKHDFFFIFESFSKYLLKVLQIRFFCSVDMPFLIHLMELIEKKDIRTLELVLPDNKDILIEEWINLISKHTKIINIYFYGSLKTDIIHEKQATVIFSKDVVPSSDACGKVSKNLFSCNRRLFGESLKYNTCLNKKVSIDIYGNIKNCPAMKKSYGHYMNVDLDKIFNSKDFQNNWKINKDRIDVCKDCEFRHMCTDCRCFIKDPENIYSQPAKCTYNPYICKWEGQEGYIPVEECGTCTKETGFVPNHEKIKELNQMIWNETE